MDLLFDLIYSKWKKNQIKIPICTQDTYLQERQEVAILISNIVFNKMDF